jgi:cytochrome P450
MNISVDIPGLIFSLLVGVAITLVLIAAFTYTQSTAQFRLQAGRSKDRSPNPPPLLPYAVPVLGSTISFSNQNIGAYWSWLRLQSTKYGHQAFSIILAGKRTHLIFSVPGISSIFKSRDLSRAGLDQQLGVTLLGMSKADALKAFPYDAEGKEKETTARIHSEHLLSSSAVNGLTMKFMECFQNELCKDECLIEGREVELYGWLWQIIFRASTTALCGSRLREKYPDFNRDYRIWEENMLGLLFGTPRLFAPKAYAARNACVQKLESWLREGYQQPVSDDPAWEPNFGARVVRKRHEFYKQQELSIHGQAGFDLIFLAGILSNATPATGWLLLHILSPLSPAGFRERIMEELESVRQSDDSIDISGLTRLPLLNSAFHEVLRLYVDLLVVRQVDISVALGSHYVRKGDQVMAPSWMTHRDPGQFERPDEFDPERFLTHDTNGKLVCSTAGLNGRYFPFGGGHYMCPGRTFARQEVLGSVAVLLLGYQIEFLEFVGGKRSRGRAHFPGFKQNYAGNQVIGIDGDMKVRTRKR